MILITELSELIEYAQLEGSELGEYTSYICDLYSRPECISPIFEPHLDAEAKRLLKDYRELTKIVKETHTQEYTHYSLEWN